VAVTAWQVHDSGLVAVLPRFRRLGGRVRHHQGRGPAWPPEVVLEVVADDLVVTTPAGVAVGTWPVGTVTAVRISSGPPVSFTLDLGEAGAHLLATAAAPEADALLAALS
jgi:hypothetical protein